MLKKIENTENTEKEKKRLITENLAYHPALKTFKIKREDKADHSSGMRSISPPVFVQGIVLENRSQFPLRFISQGVLSEKTRVNFPGEEIALYLSVSLFSISKELKIHARSTSEVFSWTALLTHFVNRSPCLPAPWNRYFPGCCSYSTGRGLRGIFHERYHFTFLVLNLQFLRDRDREKNGKFIGNTMKGVS